MLLHDVSPSARIVPSIFQIHCGLRQAALMPGYSIKQLALTLATHRTREVILTNRCAARQTHFLTPSSNELADFKSSIF